MHQVCFMEEENKTKKESSEARSLASQIQSMTIADKIRFVLKAGKEARSILVKDPNKQVAMAVLSSPKINEDEILLMAQSRNVSDDILRAIAKNRDWTRRYPICLALVNNPKTPLAVTWLFLPRIRTKDLSLLVKNHNIPQALRTSAGGLLKSRQQSS